MGLTTETCTEQACVWNNDYVKRVNPVELQNVKFYKKGCVDGKCAHVTNREFPVYTEDDKSNFLNALYKEQEKSGEPHSVGFSLLGGYSVSCESMLTHKVSKLPPDMRSYFYSGNLREEKLKEIGDLIFSAEVTKDQISYSESCIKLLTFNNTWSKFN